MIVLVVWSMWLERNAQTLNRQVKSVAQLLAQIMEEGNAWVQANYSMLPSDTQLQQVTTRSSDRELLLV